MVVLVFYSKVSAGEMRERLNRTDSKSVELNIGSVGSNPTLSAALACTVIRDES